MEQKSLMMLRILLNRYCGGVTDDSTRSLSPELVGSLKSLSLSIEDPMPLLSSSAQSLSRIHYSWFVQALDAIPKALQTATISALPPAQAKGLCRLLKCPVPDERPSPPLSELLLAGLYHAVNPEERLPAPYLPDGPLKPLALYSKTQLMRLIDLLSLRDLAQDMRLIVNKTQQEALLRCLNEEERQFFDFYLYKEQDKLSVKRLNLTEWKGDCQELRKQLHLRGMIRFGKALSGQNKDLLWYILRPLDTGRAAIIERHSAEQPQDNVAMELRRQVVGLINYFSKHE